MPVTMLMARNGLAPAQATSWPAIPTPTTASDPNSQAGFGSYWMRLRTTATIVDRT